MDFLAYIFHIPFLVYLVTRLKRFYSQSPIVSYFYFGIACKFLACILIGLVYFYYYPVQRDTVWILNAYNELVTLAVDSPQKAFHFIITQQLLREGEWPGFLKILVSTRTFYFFIMMSVFLLFSWGNYWLASLYLAFLSFWAMFALADVLAQRYPYAKFAAVVAFVFWPTVLIWSSGIFKETVLMISICIPIVLLFNSDFKNEYLIYILVSLFLMYLLKPYYWIIYMPAYLAAGLSLYWATFSDKLKKWLVFSLLLFVVLFSYLVYITKVFAPDQVMFTLVDNIAKSLLVTNAGSRYDGFAALEPTLISFLQYSPKAIWVTFFEPTFIHCTRFIQLPSVIWNGLLLIATLYAMYLYIIKGRGEITSLGIVLILYIFVLAIFLALSTPNLGTLERYKVGVLPFYVFLVLQTICRYDKIYFNKHQ